MFMAKGRRLIGMEVLSARFVGAALAQPRLCRAETQRSHLCRQNVGSEEPNSSLDNARFLMFPERSSVHRIVRCGGGERLTADFAPVAVASAGDNCKSNNEARRRAAKEERESAHDEC